MEEKKDLKEAPISDEKVNAFRQLNALRSPANPTQGSVNLLIGQLTVNGLIDTNLISDGYHTFGELYEHRIVNYMKVAQLIAGMTRHDADPIVWRSKKHSDGSEWEGWFLLGIFKTSGKQITYHLPISKWNECSFAEILDQAPVFDGHTSADVLERLKNL